MFRNTHICTHNIYVYVCATIIESIEVTSLKESEKCMWEEERGKGCNYILIWKTRNKINRDKLRTAARNTVRGAETTKVVRE